MANSQPNGNLSNSSIICFSLVDTTYYHPIYLKLSLVSCHIENKFETTGHEAIFLQDDLYLVQSGLYGDSRQFILVEFVVPYFVCFLC